MGNLRLLQLLEPEGQRALQDAAEVVQEDADFLRTMQYLSRTYSPDLAREAAAQALLRRKAAEKFTQAGRMFFTREGLEQSSGELISIYRAERLQEFPRLFDLTAGIGGDAAAFARFMLVTAVEKDPRTMTALLANRISLGIEETLHLVLADSTMRAWVFPRDSVLFLDPSRRNSRGRVYSIHQYQPDFLPFLEYLDRVEAVVVKVSPAVSMDEIGHLPAEVEFTSVQGELKEAALWFGAAACTARRATILPQGVTLTEQSPCSEEVSEIREYIYEPDPAVLRAGLVQNLAFELGCARIEPSISILTSGEAHRSDFARCYRVVEAIPFGLKRIRAALRERGIGRVTIKKRGSAVDTDIFERQLNLRGDQHAVLLLTKTGKGKVALLIEEIWPRKDD